MYCCFCLVERTSLESVLDGKFGGGGGGGGGVDKEHRVWYLVVIAWLRFKVWRRRGNVCIGIESDVSGAE